MSKAIEGAALTGAAVGMEVGAALYDPALLFSPMYQHVAEALALGGISMEAAAIAGALTSNRGINITTRQAAAFRQVIYGTQRVGGIPIYESTTGSSRDQYNYVIVLAGHEVEAIENLYLDGRQVYWQGSGAGWCIRNGVGFGGIADGADHTGPDGVTYNFGGTGHSGLYCEARFGDQTDPFGTNYPGNATWPSSGYGAIIGGLTANDGNWASNGTSAPWVGGCCYVYLKIEANSSLFPAPPEIRFTVRGKNNIYDPRTGTRGFTNNWALIAADILTDSVFGLGDDSVNEAQLIAAANVCDEQVAVGVLSGGTESRYCTDYHTDTSTGPGDMLAAVMPGAAGRLSRIGGEWYVWPAYWQGPSFACDDNALIAAPNWKPYRSLRDLYNRVRGTYTAPNYPFNVAGDLYDSNGWYNGTIQNNFPMAFQATNYPEYACDVLHGYASDEYLAADGGRQLVKELGLATVLSVTQAQRVAKIALLRNRQQGSGTLTMGVQSYGIQPCDTIQMTFPEFGWTEKTLEVTSVGFTCDQVSTGASGEKALAITLNVGVIEANPSVYEWSTTEELTVYDVPSLPTQQSLTPAPPTGMSLTCSAATATTDPITGNVTPRIEVQWATPLDVLTTQIQVQYQLENGGIPSGPWIDAGSADVSLNLFYIPAVVNQGYNVRIRSVRPNGATSVWVVVDDFTASLTLTVATQLALAPGTLIGEATGPVSFTGDTSTSSPTIANVSSVVGLLVGQSIAGAGIPAGASIISIGTTTVTLSTNPTATASAVSLTGAGTATILPLVSGSFNAVIGNTTVTVSPSNYPFPVVNQGQLYFVYYIDNTLTGGAVAAIATQDSADYLNKSGYYLIDTVITPVWSTGTGATGGRYRPSSSSDSGTRSTSNAPMAYDADITTYATVSGSFVGGGYGGSGTDGICTWSGFPAGTQPDTTLHIIAATLSVSGSIPYTLSVLIGATEYDLLSDSATIASSEYTQDIPAGTDLSTVTVVASVLGSEDGDYDSVTPIHHVASMKIYDIYIQ